MIFIPRQSHSSSSFVKESYAATRCIPSNARAMLRESLKGQNGRRRRISMVYISVYSH